MHKRWTREDSAKAHAAKAALRMAGPAPDYPPVVDHSKPIGFMLLVNYQTGEHHEMVVFPSRRRSDCFLVTVDGRVWNRCCGWWKMLEKLVKPLKQRWVNV